MQFSRASDREVGITDQAGSSRREGRLRMDPSDIAGSIGTGLLDVLKRVLGGDQSGDAGAYSRRAGVSRLLSAPARELLDLAAERAADWGSPDLGTEHLLHAATQLPDTRYVLERAGANVDDLARRMEAAAVKRHGSADQDGVPPLSPDAKQALLDAHTQSRAVRSSRIGPEHIVLGLAANPETV